MWEYYEYFAFTGIALFILTAISSFIPALNKKNYPNIASIVGLTFITIFIVLLWINLERPPMRTLGETRLWYSFFIMIFGVLIYKRFRNNWFLAYCAVLSIVFLLINYIKPEVQSKELMPALQSFWFIPHVIVYMLSYALFAQTVLLSLKGLYDISKNKKNDETLAMTDKIVYSGFGLLTLGLIFGALWAKTAWGHYWTWDPKEIWALLTWLVYLLYLHYRRHSNPSNKTLYVILITAFTVLILCWLGIKYLPNAAESVHIYS